MFGFGKKPRTREIENFAFAAIEETVGERGHSDGKIFDSAFEELITRLEDYAVRHNLGRWGRSVLCGTVDQFLSHYMRPDVRAGLIEKVRRKILI